MTNATLVADSGHQQDLLGQTVVLIGGSSGIRSLTAASLQIVVCHVAKDLQRTVWSWRQTAGCGPRRSTTGMRT